MRSRSQSGGSAQVMLAWEEALVETASSSITAPIV
jgi:hypothetical protein